MYNVSDAYLAAVAAKVRKDKVTGTITLADGNTIEVNDTVLVRDSLKLTKELCSGKYRIGTFNLSCLRFSIFIGNALGLDLTGATAELSYSIAIEENNFASVPLGTFLVDPVLSVRRKNILSITAFDRGVMFDREPSAELRALEDTPANIIIAVCEECGVGTNIEETSFDDMPNSSITVSAGEKQIQTCRDIVMWCCALLCGYAVIDRAGKLAVISAKYSVSASDSRVIDTDREISAAERRSIIVTDTRAYIKYLTAYVGKDVVNYESEFVSADEQASPAAYALECNPLLAGCTDTECDAANRAWLAYIDSFKQRGVQARIAGDPAIDVGDTIMFRGGDVDQRGGVAGVVTSLVWNYRGHQDIECLAAECCGSLLSDGSSVFSGGSSQVRSQLSKRVDAITGGEVSDNGVGEYLDDAHTAERFNDYTLNSSVMKYDHIEGQNNKVLNNYGSAFSYSGYNHVEGQGNTLNGTSGDCTHIEGGSNTYTGAGNGCNHVEGYGNTLTGGMQNHVGGLRNTVTGSSRMRVSGQQNSVSGCSDSVVNGASNNVQNVQESAVFGHGHSVRGQQGSPIVHAAVFGTNHIYEGGEKTAAIFGNYGKVDTLGQIFVIGSGSLGNNENCFEVRGINGVFATGGYNTLGADYAEYFEWADGNTDCEDRCGMLVTLDGDKLIPAHGDDILGAVSAAPSVSGNAYETFWHGKYERDVFGRVKRDDAGKPVISASFDPDAEYIPRSQRSEWAAVGLTGRLVIRDDGSCKVGGFVSARRGVGTSCYKNTGVRVLRRIDERHAEVLIK